jgi:hypothetical protein
MSGGRQVITRVFQRSALRARKLNPWRQTLFQGFWHGPSLGVFRRACLRSFIELGHQFHLYSHEPVDVPAGVVLMDANEVIPFEEMFYYWDPMKERDDLGPFPICSGSVCSICAADGGPTSTAFASRPTFQKSEVHGLESSPSFGLQM